MKRRRTYGIGFVAGILLVPVLVYLRKTGVIVRHGDFEYALTVIAVVGILASLPFVAMRGVKESVPAKKSDWIGYVVILAALAAVAYIAYRVTKD